MRGMFRSSRGPGRASRKIGSLSIASTKVVFVWLLQNRVRSSCTVANWIFPDTRIESWQFCRRQYRTSQRRRRCTPGSWNRWRSALALYDQVDNIGSAEAVTSVYDADIQDGLLQSRSRCRKKSYFTICLLLTTRHPIA